MTIKEKVKETKEKVSEKLVDDKNEWWKWYTTKFYVVAGILLSFAADNLSTAAYAAQYFSPVVRTIVVISVFTILPILLRLVNQKGQSDE